MTAWWWNERLRDILKRTKLLFKEWKGDDNIEAEERYSLANREAKRAVKEARDEAESELYESLGTREREKKIYKIARAGQIRRQDLGKIGMIKDRNGRILQDEEQIKNRWKEYFNILLNVENERGELDEVAKTEGPINQISREEIKEAMRKMKSEKAAGPSEVVIELIKAMGANGENWTLELAVRE